jgi:hypothetical protein
MVREWLGRGMFAGENAGAKIDTIVAELRDHALTKSHARHLSAKRYADMGLKVVRLEDDQELQEKVLTFAPRLRTHAFLNRCIQDHREPKCVTFIQITQMVAVQSLPAPRGRRTILAMKPPADLIERRQTQR